jgi:hypothetical protein
MDLDTVPRSKTMRKWKRECIDLIDGIGLCGFWCGWFSYCFYLSYFENTNLSDLVCAAQDPSAFSKSVLSEEEVLS